MMSDGTWHLPVAIGDDWEGRHHDHSTEVEPSWAVAQLVVRNHNLTAILTDLIAELRYRAAGYPGATGRWLTEEADRAEARLMSLNKGHKDMEVTGDE